jgi:tRNA pseudouridine synthase 9
VVHLLCRGEFLVDQPLLTVDKQSGLVIVTPEGKEAKTTFNRLFYDESRDESVVSCKPLTGRSPSPHLLCLLSRFSSFSKTNSWQRTFTFPSVAHQIRVHLQYLGHPIPNDPLYALESVWSANVNNAKGGIDLTPAENPIYTPDYHPPAKEAPSSPTTATPEPSSSSTQAPAAEKEETIEGVDTDGVEHAKRIVAQRMTVLQEKKRAAEEAEEEKKTGVKAEKKLMPRELGSDIGSSSPIKLSQEAIEIIRRLRRMKDEMEDWARSVGNRSFLFLSSSRFKEAIQLCLPLIIFLVIFGSGWLVLRWKDVVLYTKEASASPAIIHSLQTRFDNDPSLPVNRHTGSEAFTTNPESSDPSAATTVTTVELTSTPPASSSSTADAPSAPDAAPSKPSKFIPPPGFCPQCFIPLAPDPDPDRLFIYLHALRYKTSYGHFETGMPVWAREDWNGEEGWEVRAKGQGKGGQVKEGEVVKKVTVRESGEVVEEVVGGEGEEEEDGKKKGGLGWRERKERRRSLSQEERCS